MWPYLQIRLWTSKPYACSQRTFLILRCIVVVDNDGQLQAKPSQAKGYNPQIIARAQATETPMNWHPSIQVTCFRWGKQLHGADQPDDRTLNKNALNTHIPHKYKNTHNNITKNDVNLHYITNITKSNWCKLCTSCKQLP